MLIVRTFRESDRAALIALWQACGLTRPWNDPDKDIDLCQRSTGSTLLIAEQDGALAGGVMVGHDGHRGWVYYLAADPARQTKGTGRSLMQAAEDWLKSRGVPKIMLMVRPENTKVRGFYEALGYQEEPRVIFSRRLDGKEA